ncbi:Alpha/Beta hydrolase protein [Dipodascopsis tothii]|uniref:Alpha/Beta hydrolase protein n=1 Tax=Dipodascopsis tothii TaxID=44089 RepID=UPI0034CF1173
MSDDVSRPRTGPRNLGFGVFPLSYREAISQWWGGATLEESERAVLSFLPFFPESDGVRQATSSMVPLARKGHELNEFRIERVGEAVENDLVILHGYGAGLGFFYRNFDELSSVKGWRLHALDLLGYGRSTRPRFSVRAKGDRERVYEAENWFVDSLEEWRVKRNIDQFTLMAHSMGGYLGVAYARKYPERLKKLILVSPVGVPEDPWGSGSAAITPHDPPTALQQEFTASQESTTQHAARPQPPPKRPLPAWFVFLWERHVSPFSVIRLAGPLGPRLVSGWTQRRFSKLSTAEFEALHSYTYNIFNARGSGEYALPYLLAPGAYARFPLINRLDKLRCPTLWMYGENDWMDVSAGKAAVQKLRSQGKDADIAVVEAAGHHLYLDNPTAFNEIIVDEMRKVSPSHPST